MSQDRHCLLAYTERSVASFPGPHPAPAILQAIDRKLGEDLGTRVRKKYTLSHSCSPSFTLPPLSNFLLSPPTLSPPHCSSSCSDRNWHSTSYPRIQNWWSSSPSPPARSSMVLHSRSWQWPICWTRNYTSHNSDNRIHTIILWFCRHALYKPDNINCCPAEK